MDNAVHEQLDLHQSWARLCSALATLTSRVKWIKEICYPSEAEMCVSLAVCQCTY